jgi:DNA repair protein RadC
MHLLTNYELRIKREAIGEKHATYEKRIHNEDDVAALARTVAGDLAQEVVLVFLLDVKNRLVGFTEAARGAIDSCPVDLRQVFRVAIISGACGIILAHNHPSGDPTPSDEDRRLTRRVAEAAELLGIRLLDHVVVTDADHASMRARGELA